MNGDGFYPKAKEGDTCKKGQLLLEFDIDKIRAAGHDITSPVVITNADSYKVSAIEMECCEPGNIILIADK